MKRQRHILVVDDDDDVRGIIALMLAARGCRVSVAASGEGMRGVLGNNSDPVDAVVLDVVLKGEHGFELQGEATNSGVPVVMISGNLEAMRLAEEHQLPLLSKPFGSDQSTMP